MSANRSWDEDSDLKAAADSLRQAHKPDLLACSEDALALDFTARYADELRYVAPWGKWMHWTGTRWKFEDTLMTFDLARKVGREFATTFKNAQLAKAHIVAAIEKLARADRHHAATVVQWDADAWLVNTPAGVIDLQSGDTMPHEPSLYMTKQMSVGPEGECPLWLAFLDRVTAGDTELAAYLQRIAGYCMTGCTRDHAMFFLYGTGANGKGVFLNTLRAIWATTPSSPQWKPLLKQRAIVTRRTWRCCAAHASSSPRKPRKGAIGPKPKSAP
jgi:phage/plasmid-associated DNA primase